MRVASMKSLHKQKPEISVKKLQLNSPIRTAEKPTYSNKSRLKRSTNTRENLHSKKETKDQKRLTYSRTSRHLKTMKDLQTGKLTPRELEDQSSWATPRNNSKASYRRKISIKPKLPQQAKLTSDHKSPRFFSQLNISPIPPCSTPDKMNDKSILNILQTLKR